MKSATATLLLLSLLVCGCDYEAPLTQENTIPIDAAVLGLWEIVPEPQDSDPAEEMVVLKYSDTEYLVHYPTGKEGLYFRGYPIKVGDISCVQVQLIGTAEGSIKEDERGYHVVSYTATNDLLIVKTLNTDIVDSDIADSDELRKEFIANKHRTDLFIDPGTFRRVKEKPEQ